VAIHIRFDTRRTCGFRSSNARCVYNLDVVTTKAHFSGIFSREVLVRPGRSLLLLCLIELWVKLPLCRGVRRVTAAVACLTTPVISDIGLATMPHEATETAVTVLPGMRIVVASTAALTSGTACHGLVHTIGPALVGTPTTGGGWYLIFHGNILLFTLIV
jgi:hypothetical protein